MVPAVPFPMSQRGTDYLKVNSWPLPAIRHNRSQGAGIALSGYRIRINFSIANSRPRPTGSILKKEPPVIDGPERLKVRISRYASWLMSLYVVI